MANAINSLNFGDNTYTFTLPYGVCSTAAATAAKAVTVDNFSLETGAVVIVKFSEANSASSPTLNVNGTGAKSIYRYGTTAASTSAASTGWRAGAVQMFVYDGTGWVRDFWENSTYANYSLGQGYGTCATAAATAAKVVTLSNYSLSLGGIVAVKFTYAVPANATMNINSKGAKNIYFGGAAITANVIKAGDIATFMYDGTQYQLLSVDRWHDDIASLQTTMSNGAGTAGLIKTTSTVTSNSGYTACPVINGVPYYKDTDTTYTSLKNPYALTIQGNGTTLTNGTYDGSAAKTVNITASGIGAASATHNHAASEITSGTLSVSRGGTGAASFTAGRALIGNGTSAFSERYITDHTDTSGIILADNSLITSNTLRNALNRASSVANGNSNYDTYMVRGTSLNLTEVTPEQNGQIAWMYE